MLEHPSINNSVTTLSKHRNLITFYKLDITYWSGCSSLPQKRQKKVTRNERTEMIFCSNFYTQRKFFKIKSCTYHNKRKNGNLTKCIFLFSGHLFGAQGGFKQSNLNYFVSRRSKLYLLLVRNFCELESFCNQGTQIYGDYPR